MCGSSGVWCVWFVGILWERLVFCLWFVCLDCEFYFSFLRPRLAWDSFRALSNVMPNIFLYKVNRILKNTLTRKCFCIILLSFNFSVLDPGLFLVMVPFWSLSCTDYVTAARWNQSWAGTDIYEASANSWGIVMLHESWSNSCRYNHLICVSANNLDAMMQNHIAQICILTLIAQMLTIYASNSPSPFLSSSSSEEDDANYFSAPTLREDVQGNHLLLEVISPSFLYVRHLYLACDPMLISLSISRTYACIPKQMPCF